MSVEWYYAENGQQRGPITFEELKRRAASGLLRPTDLIWGPTLIDWVPASTQFGLFGGARAGAQAAPPPRPDFDDDRFYERRPKATGTNAAAKIVLYSCGGFMLLSVLCCGMLFMFGRNDSPPRKHKSDRRWGLKSGEYSSWTHQFNQGDDVVITVTSKSDSDMDVFVFAGKDKLDTFLRANNLDNELHLCVIADIRLDKDCKVEFIAPETGEYRVLLMNRKSEQRERNIQNSGRIVVESKLK